MSEAPSASLSLREALTRLSRHTLVYAVAGQLSRVAGFLLIPFYTSYLDQRAYGINDLLSQIIAVLSYVAGINMTTAMARYYFEQKSADEQEPRLAVDPAVQRVAGEHK